MDTDIIIERRNNRAKTHCNTLQHTATYCNILQHTATHYGHRYHHWAPQLNRAVKLGVAQMQHIATHCNTLQHTTTQCNTLWTPISSLSAATIELSNSALRRCNIECWYALSPPRFAAYACILCIHESCHACVLCINESWHALCINESWQNTYTYVSCSVLQCLVYKWLSMSHDKTLIHTSLAVCCSVLCINESWHALCINGTWQTKRMSWLIYALMYTQSVCHDSFKHKV